MAQKKSELTAVAKTDVKMNAPVENVTFIDTFWDQYEQSLIRARKLRENREEAYIKTLKEVMKFNREYRKSLASLYKEARKTNIEIVKGLASNLPKKEQPEQVEPKPENERAELMKQVQDVSGQLENLVLTPVKSTFGLIERLEKNIEENVENYVKYSRERREGWNHVTDEYVKLARKSHHDIVDRVGESLKVLVNAK